MKYTEGLKINGLSNPEVVSTLLSNRAQAQLRLANNRSALNDASKALKADRCNVKVQPGVREVLPCMLASAFGKLDQLPCPISWNG